MRCDRLCIPLFIVCLAACGRSSETSRSGGASNNIERDPTSRTTTISTNGGIASSPDGIFSVLVSENTFDEDVTVEIEKLNEFPAQESASLSSAYRMNFKPQGLALETGESIQVRFGVSDDAVAATGIANMRIVYRTDSTGSFTSELEPRMNQGRAWAPTSLLAGDFGLVDIRAAANDCECDEDDECSEGCDCDSDCEGNSGGSGSNSDEGDCTGAEFSCASGDQCIPLIYRCDGTAHCADESDEDEALCAGSGTNPLNGDEFEPDNSFGSPSSVVLGQAQNRTLTIEDMDFMRFEIDSRQDVTVLATGATFENRVILQLYSSTQEQLANSGGGFMDNPDPISVRAVLEAGTYYVVASSQNNDSIVSYQLTVTASEPLPPGPQLLEGEVAQGKVSLSWDAVEGADSYKVYYSDMPDGPHASSEWVVAANGPSPITTETTTLDVLGLPNFQPIFFVVVAVIDERETYPSNELDFMIPMSADEFEENDSLETANNLHSEAIVSGTYTQVHSCHEPGDKDFVKFELAGVNNSISARTSGSMYSDTYLTLYNSEGEIIAQNDNVDEVMGDFYSKVDKSGMEPGIYYLETRANDVSDSFGSYILTVTITSDGVPSADPDDFEEDNTLESVRTAEETVIEAGTPQNRTIHNADDVDYVRFVLAADANIVVSTTGESGDTSLKVYNDAGEEIGSDTTSGFSTVTLEDLTAGTYFAKVASQGVPAVISAYQLSLVVYEKPNAPTNVVVTPGPGTLTVTWDSVSNATSYQVYYVYSNNSPDSVATAAQGSSPLNTQASPFVLSGLPTTAPTGVCVKALNNTATSACSSTVNGQPLGN